MRFTVAELPVVCALAEEYVAHYRLQDRIDTASLDMFSDPWPSGYDAHFLSNIFHDWSWERCRLLARQSFESLPPGVRIYLHEMLLEDTRDAPLAATSFSKNMIFSPKASSSPAGNSRSCLAKPASRRLRSRLATATTRSLPEGSCDCMGVPNSWSRLKLPR
jgi:hypothetical protein